MSALFMKATDCFILRRAFGQNVKCGGGSSAGVTKKRVNIPVPFTKWKSLVRRVVDIFLARSSKVESLRRRDSRRGSAPLWRKKPNVSNNKCAVHFPHCVSRLLNVQNNMAKTSLLISSAQLFVYYTDCGPCVLLLSAGRVCDEGTSPAVMIFPGLFEQKCLWQAWSANWCRDPPSEEVDCSQYCITTEPQMFIWATFGSFSALTFSGLEDENYSQAFLIGLFTSRLILFAILEFHGDDCVHCKSTWQQQNVSHQQKQDHMTLFFVCPLCVVDRFSTIEAQVGVLFKGSPRPV